MRYLLLSAFYLFPFTLVAQPSAVNVKPLYNYDFVGDATDLKPGVNCFVITDRRYFDKFFGKSARPDTPHFTKENVLVLLMPQTNKDSKLGFKKVDKAGDFMDAYCELELNKGKLPYKFFPVAVAVIPKYHGVRKVNFYNDTRRIIRTVEVK